MPGSFLKFLKFLFASIRQYELCRQSVYSLTYKVAGHHVWYSSFKMHYLSMQYHYLQRDLYDIKLDKANLFIILLPINVLQFTWNRLTGWKYDENRKNAECLLYKRRIAKVQTSSWKSHYHDIYQIFLRQRCCLGVT